MKQILLTSIMALNVFSFPCFAVGENAPVDQEEFKKPSSIPHPLGHYSDLTGQNHRTTPNPHQFPRPLLYTRGQTFCGALPPSMYENNLKAEETSED